MIKYEFYRLGFKRDIIEPLADNDSFSVITPEGTFRMTKRQFYITFSNVVKTFSYREKGLYHYPSIPQKALQFLV